MFERLAQRLRPLLRAVLLAAVAAGLVFSLYFVFLANRGWDEFLNFGATPDRFPGMGELRLYWLLVAFGAPAAACAALLLYRVPLPRWLTEARPSARQLQLLAAVLGPLGSWAIAHFVTHYSWFTDDEQAYFYQVSRYLKWQLTGPVLQPPEMFLQRFVVQTTVDGQPRWAGAYPPLQPLMMAFSQRLGNMSLSQFLCVGILIYNTGRFARTLWNSERAGIYASWLCALSPLLLGLAASYHTSILAATLSVCSARLLLWAMDSRSVLKGLAVGLTAGAIFLTRPLEGTLVILMFGVALLSRLRFRRQIWPNSFLPAMGYGIGGILVFAIYVWINLRTTSDPLLTSYALMEVKIGKFFGFHTNMMWARNHTPGLGALQTAGALTRLNGWLFGWPLSLLPLALGLLAPFRNRKVLLLCAMSVVQLSGYFPLAFGSVHDFGSAYHVWHLPWIAAITSWVFIRSEQWLERFPHVQPQRLVLAIWFGLTAAAAATFWPIQLQRLNQVSSIVRAPVVAAEQTLKDQKAIVLWSAYTPPGQPIRTWVYTAPYNDEGQRILWAYDIPRLYSRMRKEFPEHKVYRLEWSGTKAKITPANLGR